MPQKNISNTLLSYNIECIFSAIKLMKEFHMLLEIKEYQGRVFEEIRRHRWLESEKAGHDLGERAEKEWFTKYEIDFRKYWMENRFSLN